MHIRGFSPAVQSGSVVLNDSIRKWFIVTRTGVAKGLWIRMWLFKLPDSTNDLSHMEHLKGFSSAWISMCLFKFPVCTNDLPQIKQLKGFSPVWIRMCFFKFSGRKNDLSHIEHIKGFSPVWIRMCFFKFPVCENDLSQIKHLKGSLQCESVCDFLKSQIVKTIYHKSNI